MSYQGENRPEGQHMGISGWLWRCKAVRLCTCACMRGCTHALTFVCVCLLGEQQGARRRRGKHTDPFSASSPAISLTSSLYFPRKMTPKLCPLQKEIYPNMKEEMSALLADERRSYDYSLVIHHTPHPPPQPPRAPPPPPSCPILSQVFLSERQGTENTVVIPDWALRGFGSGDDWHGSMSEAGFKLSFRHPPNFSGYDS